MLSSFVQSTFGSSDDDKAEREIIEHKKVKSSEKSQDKLIENSKNKDTNKKSKIENKKLEELNSKKEDKETTVDTSKDNKDVSPSNKTELKEGEKSSKKEKFSFRNLFPWLRKSDSKSENSEVLENKSTTQEDKSDKLNKKNVDKNKEQTSLNSKNQNTEKEINNLDNQKTNVQSKTKRFSKVSGEESVIYEKTANDKKIIKRLEK